MVGNWHNYHLISQFLQINCNNKFARKVPYVIHPHHVRHMRLSHILISNTLSRIRQTVLSCTQLAFSMDFDKMCMCHCPELHLQNIKHEPAIYLREHLTVAHFVHVQLCGRSTGNNGISLAGRSIPSASLRSNPNSQESILATVDMGRVDRTHNV